MLIICIKHSCDKHNSDIIISNVPPNLKDKNGKRVDGAPNLSEKNDNYYDNDYYSNQDMSDVRILNDLTAIKQRMSDLDNLDHNTKYRLAYHDDYFDISHDEDEVTNNPELIVRINSNDNNYQETDDHINLPISNIDKNTVTATIPSMVITTEQRKNDQKIIPTKTGTPLKLYESNNYGKKNESKESDSKKNINKLKKNAIATTLNG